jgi:dTDP-4-dehydrorhamnose reductase
MKTLVIGASGQLGRDLCPRLSGDVIPLTRADADLTNLEATATKLGEIRPDIIINCAAYNLVDKAESEPEVAFAVNAWAVGNLAVISKKLDCKLVHFSTDYVFGQDADHRTPWEETDTAGPISHYGMSKLTGERLVQSISPKHFVIRTCGLYGMWGTGGKGGNFVETMLRVAGQGKPLKVVDDQRCTPSYTVDVAETTIALLATEAYGLYHITNEGECSWYEFAREIFRLSGLSPQLSAIPSSGYPQPARRPAYSVLSKKKLATVGVKAPRPWQEALKDYLDERKCKK